MNLPPVFYRNTNEPKEKQWQRNLLRKWLHKGAILAIHFIKEPDTVTNGAIVIHTQRLKSDPGGNLLS
ncbi:hypothetical protein BFI49_18550 [Yersinia pestis subsp. microtus bv. Altaica]|nr:hypothetical protein BFI49_18550 [Yersinia pestis subsp. microtus bv. Altaica]